MAEGLQVEVKKMFFVEDVVGKFVGHLASLGLWPVQPADESRGLARAKHGWNFFELWFSAALVGVICPVTIYHSWGEDLTIITEISGGIFVLGLIIVQTSCLLLRKDSLRSMSDALRTMRTLGGQHRECPKDVNETRMRDSLIAMGYYAVTMTIVVASAIALPMYCWRKKEFVLRFWWPYDYKPSPYLELTTSVLIGICIYGIMKIILINALFLAIFAETSYQLKLLQHNFIVVVRNLTATESQTVTKQVKQTLRIKLSKARRRMRYALTALKKSDRQIKTRENSGNVTNVPDSGRPCRLTIVGQLRKTIMTPDRVDEKAELRFGQCVKHHQAITKFVDEVESAFGAILFFQFICVVCPVMIGTILVLHAETIDEKTFFFIGLTLSAMAQQGLVCFLADQVASEGESVRDAVIGCDWYGASEGFKRSMRIVMSRSNQPLVLNPGGIPVTLKTFYAVLKITFNFYMSLSAVLSTSLQGHQ